MASNEPIELRSVSTNHLPDECAASKWNHRKVKSRGIIPFLQFLTSVVFWQRVEYAVRIAFVGVLPTAIIAFHPETTHTWIIPGVMLTFCIVVSQNSVARSLEEFLQVIRALVLCVILSEIALAIDPARHWAGWGALFAGVNILVGLFTAGLVTKLGLFGWVIFMVLHYKNEAVTHDVYSGPPEFMKQCIVGAAFGLLTAFFPYPYFETWKAQKLEKKVLKLLSLQFLGLTEGIYTDNLSRSISLVSIRQLHNEIEEQTVALSQALDLAHVEVWFTTRVHAMKGRLQLILRMVRDANAALEGLEAVNRHRTEWETAEFFEFGKILLPHMRRGAIQVEWYLSKLSLEGRVTDEMLKGIEVTKSQLDEEFLAARKTVIFPLLDSIQERPFSRYPFLSSNSFLFPWKDTVDALSEFREEASPSVLSVIGHALLFPVRDVQAFFQTLVSLFKLEGPALIRLRESFKLSFAMTTAVAFLLNRNTQDPAGGAAVIGFLMDADSSNNVLTGVRFLLGCVFGSVFGLLCNSVSQDLTQSIIWMVVITLVTGFGKSGPKWGQTMFFIMFFGLSSMAPGASETSIIKTIQQDVVAISWLVFVSNFFWPTYPSTFLHESIQQSLRQCRHFTVQFLKAFGPAVPLGSFNEKDLFVAMSDVRLTMIRQLPLIEAAGEEPSIRVDNFPFSVYRNYNKALRRFVSHFAPLITAGRFLSSMPAKMHMLTSIEQPLLSLSEELNLLLRMLEELVEVKSQTPWGGSSSALGASPMLPASDILTQMKQVRITSEAVLEKANATFMEQWHLIKSGEVKAPTPYEVPAAHLILSCIDRLQFDVYELVLAVMAVRELYQ